MTGRSAYPEVVNVPKRVGSGLPRVWLDVSIGVAKSAPLTLTLTLTLILTLTLTLTLTLSRHASSARSWLTSSRWSSTSSPYRLGLGQG